MISLKRQMHCSCVQFQPLFKPRESQRFPSFDVDDRATENMQSWNISKDQHSVKNIAHWGEVFLDHRLEFFTWTAKTAFLIWYNDIINWSDSRTICGRCCTSWPTVWFSRKAFWDSPCHDLSGSSVRAPSWCLLISHSEVDTLASSLGWNLKFPMQASWFLFRVVILSFQQCKKLRTALLQCDFLSSLAIIMVGLSCSGGPKPILSCGPLLTTWHRAPNPTRQEILEKTL